MTLEKVSIGRVKRFPAEVIAEVVRKGRPVELTKRGQPLGAVIAPTKSGAKPWATGADVNELLRRSPLSRENSVKLRNQIEEMRDSDFVRDPWDETHWIDDVAS